MNVALLPGQHVALVHCVDFLRQAAQHDVDDQESIVWLVGPRGAGKTTILRRLRDQLGDSNSHCVTEPLDCSLFPEEVPPVTGVLLHLARTIREHRTASTPSGKQALEKLQSIAALPVHLHRDYRTLSIDLSTTHEEFERHVIDGVDTALTLRSKLAEWLRESARPLLGGKRLVLLLDNVDLVPAVTLRAWATCLLDGLRQPELVVVATGDARRLSRLAKRLDDNADTARSLLQTLDNAIHIERSELGSRGDFVPFEEPDKTRTINRLIGSCNGSFSECDRAVLLGLLPARPRQLRQFYRVLSPAVSATARQAPGSSVGLTSHGVLRRLALVRREHRIDAWIERCASHGVLGDLRWAARHDRGRAPLDLQIESWDSAVTAASQAATAGSMPAQPLEALGPLHHDPTDQSYRDPLRDAEGPDRALWAELLVNRSIRDNPSQRARFLEAWRVAGQRAAGAQLSVEFTREQLWQLFEEDAPLHELLVWFSDRPRDGARSYIIDMGWAPLLAALRGARRVWPGRLMADLLVPAATLAHPDAGTPPAHDPPLALLPGDVRALVLLVDALDRCPWEAFSQPRFGWRMTTYLLLAGAFVRSAYVSALSKRSPAWTCGPWQQRMLMRLDTADPGLRAQAPLNTRSSALLQEDEWREELANLYAEPLPFVEERVRDEPAHTAHGRRKAAHVRRSAPGPEAAQSGGAPTDALLNAAQVFFRSSAYGALARLAREGAGDSA